MHSAYLLNAKGFFENPYLVQRIGKTVFPEYAGYNVMYELLNHFIPPIIREKLERKGFEKKALQLIPSQFIYEDGTVYEKVLGVLDFVSGMTDNFATDLYRKIKGIDIGMTM